ncbi:hypothetical protein CLOSBL3_10289 [Clostridiaceae bacterium BL-3]|nr:hypothetical protein CLOSBL3_10289 [Clostridiaceae bacterium BL-3]
MILIYILDNMYTLYIIIYKVYIEINKENIEYVDIMLFLKALFFWH